MAGFLSRLPDVEKAAGIDPRTHAVVLLKDQQDALHVFRLLRESQNDDDSEDTVETVEGIIRIIGKHEC
jgi:hypothetical protein